MNILLFGNQKWARNSKLTPLHGVFLPNTIFFGSKIRIQYSKTPWVIEEENYTTKTVNAYIVHDLDKEIVIKKAICTIARNVAIFGLNNSSSSYTDNWKKNFLVLGKGDAFGFNGTFSEREIEFNVIFSNARSNFWICITMVMIVICFLMEKKSISLKQIKMCMIYMI